MKKIFITSLILVLVPCLLFSVVYGYLIYMTSANAQDYSDDILGQWEAIQYYYGSDRIACKDDVWINIAFDDSTVTIDGTVLPAQTADYEWEGGTSLTFQSETQTVRYLISFDNHNNLKIIIDDTSYIILLRRSEV